MVDAPERPDVDDQLWQRVCGEYREMPGLQLTIAQAARLWNLPLALGQQLLDGLVDAAFLRRRGNRYVRADAGPVRD